MPGRVKDATKLVKHVAASDAFGGGFIHRGVSSVSVVWRGG